MLLTMLLCFPAQAYELYDAHGTPPRWDITGGAVMTVRTYSFGTGSELTDIEDAVSEWDHDTIPGSSFGATSGPSSSTANVRANNHVNEIAAVDFGDADCSDNFATTNFRAKRNDGSPGNHHIKEADILVNYACDMRASYDWYDIWDASVYAGTYSIKQTVIHEMGHVSGLNHEDGYFMWGDGTSAGATHSGVPSSEYHEHAGSWEAYWGYPATMQWNNTGTAVGDTSFLGRQYEVNEDDRQGLRALYPASNNDDVDIAIQSYYLPDDDSVASHGTNCFNNIAERSRPAPYTDFLALGVEAGLDYGHCTDTLLATLPSPLKLVAGQPIDVVFTLLDLGNSDLTSVPWKVYLSPSATSLTGALEMNSFSTDLDVNIPYERVTNVTIPITATEGTWYIVAVMDPDDDIDERNENNNMAYWNQEVEIVLTPSTCGCSSSTGSEANVVGLGLAAVAWLRRRRPR